MVLTHGGSTEKVGKLRMTVDLTKVNDLTYRELHHQITPHDLVCDIPRDQVKTILDCWNGYHSVNLDDDAKDATTFITEEGTFRFCRTPQGFHESSDKYTRRTDEITKDTEDSHKCIDDSCLFKPTIAELFHHTVKYIDKCRLNGIVFNPNKFVFGKTDVDFAGFHLTSSGYKPTTVTTQAIMQIPVPESLTDVRSFFGLVEQVSYAFSKAEVMAPFRELLQKNRRFYWDDHLTALFDNAKRVIVEKVKDGVESFEIGLTSMITTDYSKEGVGYFLQQKYCKCPVADI